MSHPTASAQQEGQEERAGGATDGDRPAPVEPWVDAWE